MLGHHERVHAQARLGQVFDTAPRVLFDDSSRLVFFADCHRGDNGRADMFARNKGLFLDALHYYYNQGFTYVEVGDGDELWQNRRFREVRRAHESIFDLFHEFSEQQRLHLVVGNHEIVGRRRDSVEKDGLVVHEGLVFRHAADRVHILVVHGHQADLKSDRLSFVGRPAVRMLKHVQRLGLARYASLPGDVWSECKIDRRIREWAHLKQQPVICGHTHRPAYASYGAPPYYNTGSCLVPGAITGLEIQDGQITLVRWTGQPGRKRAGPSSIKRELVSAPRAVSMLA